MIIEKPGKQEDMWTGEIGGRMGVFLDAAGMGVAIVFSGKCDKASD